MGRLLQFKLVENKKKKDDFFGLDKTTVALGASALSLLIGIGMAAPQVTAFIKNLTQMQQQSQQPPLPQPEAQVEHQVQQPEQVQQTDDVSALEEGQTTVSKKRGYIDEVDPFGQKISVPILKRDQGQSIKEHDLGRINIGEG